MFQSTKAEVNSEDNKVIANIFTTKYIAIYIIALMVAMVPLSRRNFSI